MTSTKRNQKWMARWIYLVNLYLLVVIAHSIFGNVFLHAETFQEQNILFNNLPRVALLVKEQYVDPKKINPNAMLAAVLGTLESGITGLVVSLPQYLEKSLELARATEEKKLTTAKEEQKSIANINPQPKEQLLLDLGGTKKIFDYEPQRSIWGMTFFLRDIFRFIEIEAKKQGLTEKSNVKEEPIDWEKIEDNAINGMLSTLDPHSVWFKDSRDLTVTTKGQFGGVGIVISVRNGFLTVISPIADTPAARVGVKALDQIIKIGDESAINLDLNRAVDKLRGEPNTWVKITVKRQNAAKELEFNLKRAIIKVDSVAYALLDNDLGYLQIKAFQGNTAQDVKNGVLAMKKKSRGHMNGLILDLRSNPGGLLREAVEVSNLFLSGGEIVSTQGARPDSRQVEFASAGELDPKLKIIVLVDGGSASASEIVASAIKDGGVTNGRGIVVGEQTFGKGSVQMLFDFPKNPRAENLGPSLAKDKDTDNALSEQPAALKLTIAEYFGPNNTSIQTIGVSPDIALSPVKVGKREESKLFPIIGTREADLEGHLSTENSKVESKEKKSLINLEFLSPNESEEVAEYGKLNLTKLKKDFAVITATELLKASKGITRTELLANAKDISQKLQKQEHKKIIEALKKNNIDWSLGTNQANSLLSASITSNKGASAGEKLKVAVKVKNTSKEPLFQVHGITHSKTPLFDQKEFLFGKLAPGQEIERFVEFEIPKDVITRKDLMSLELRDYHREKITELDIQLDIKGLKRPRFSHMAYIENSKTGNTKTQDDNEFELALWLKNIGQGKAFQPIVLLRNESGSKVFLKNGRFQSKELLPNQETSMKFTFRVKEPTDKVNFEIQIFDGEMHDLWRDKIVFDLPTKPIANKINRYMMVKTEDSLLDKPVETGRKLALLHEGLKVNALKENDDFLLVKVNDSLLGFVKKSAVRDINKKEATAKQAKNLYSIIYDRIPPQVSLKFGDASGLSASESGKVTAEINGIDRLSTLLLYVNNKKVLYKDLSKDKSQNKFEHLVNLKPGVNVISLFASEDATYGQRESITVFYDEDGRAVRSLSQAPIRSADSN